jgi:hypothetical protein
MGKTGMLLCAAPVLLCCAGAQADTAAPAAAPPHIYGGIERVRITGEASVELLARLDSGAETTELHANNIKYMSHTDSSTWVSFDVDAGSVLPGREVNYKLPVLKDVHVHQSSGGIEHEPVVSLDLCVGNRLLSAEVSLRTRHDYTPALVLGRPELAQLGTVDAQKQYTVEPSCTSAGASAAQSR